MKLNKLVSTLNMEHEDMAGNTDVKVSAVLMQEVSVD